MSSSFDFRGIRIQGNDPQTQFIIELQKRLIQFLTENQVAALESENEDIYLDAPDMETAIKWHSELGSQQLFDFHRTYYPPFEPDGQFVTLYIKGRNLGNTLTDYSGFNNFITIHGDPTLVAGPADFDPGIHTHGTKAKAIRFNRPTSKFENDEWLQITDSTRLQIAGQTVGFSLFVRFICYSLADQGDWSPTIYEKIDDSTAIPNDAQMLEVKSDGRLVFIVRDGAVNVPKQTAAGTIVAGEIYDVFVTYGVSGAVMHVYVNGVDKTLSNFTGNINWQTDNNNHDMCIARRGLGEDAGFHYCDVFIFKYYREMIVSQTQVTNHWINKQTISPHPFGRTMVANYFATKLASYINTFTPGSFSSISFSM
jgi:hypothetical protein